MKSPKLKVIIGAAFCVAGILNLAAADSAAEAKKISEEVKKLIEVSSTVRPVKAEGVDEVLMGKLYEVEVKMNDAFTMHKTKVVMVANGAVMLDQPSTTQPCPELKQVLNPDFNLKTIEDAKKVEAILDAVYPISDTGDKKLKAIHSKGDRFIFVRGDFFDGLKGFVFTIDADGKILKVDHDLRLKME